MKLRSIKSVKIRSSILVYLENGRNNVDDPSLENEIEYLKSRIERLEAKNQEFEEKVRGA